MDPASDARILGLDREFFLAGDDPAAPDVAAALEGFSTRALALDVRRAYGRMPKRPGVCYFFPRPAAGSACKRLNLFLRWMVRHDEIDLGVWTRLSPARLIVPLDTHVIRLGRCLRLTRYVSPGWKMAADITASLRHARCDRSRALRFFHLPRRHDECLRLRPPAGRFAMSAQRALSSAARPRTTLRLIAAFLLGVALGAAGALLVTARATDATRRRVTARAVSPDKSRVAVAREVPWPEGTVRSCGWGTEDASTVVAVAHQPVRPRSRGPRTGHAWRSCSTRGDVIYNAQTSKLAGIVRLLASEAARPASRAASPSPKTAAPPTFDDCPRTHSGCRAGVVGSAAVRSVGSSRLWASALKPEIG